MICVVRSDQSGRVPTILSGYCVKVTTLLMGPRSVGLQVGVDIDMFVARWAKTDRFRYLRKLSPRYTKLKLAPGFGLTRPAFEMC